MLLVHFQQHAENEQLSQNGALLCCVIGGKMSEGINFSDDLGRFVGLTFHLLPAVRFNYKMLIGSCLVYFCTYKLEVSRILRIEL